MNNFDDELHLMTKSADGSYTAYSKEYDEHYHSTKDGALLESLCKHVEPAFRLLKGKDEINILDICFGLGFNTLTTIYHAKKIGFCKKINIFSPELDAGLVESLAHFEYPSEFAEFCEIVSELSKNRRYSKGNLHVEIFLGDAREYVKSFAPKTFDIVYQDAFSPKANPSLWTREYFADIERIIKQDGVLTTYSTAIATRLALFENGFEIYMNKGEGYRNATVASLSDLEGFEKVDVAHKVSCNPNARSLRD